MCHDVQTFTCGACFLASNTAHCWMFIIIFFPVLGKKTWLILYCCASQEGGRHPFALPPVQPRLCKRWPTQYLNKEKATTPTPNYYGPQTAQGCFGQANKRDHMAPLNTTQSYQNLSKLEALPSLQWAKKIKNLNKHAAITVMLGTH